MWGGGAACVGGCIPEVDDVVGVGALEIVLYELSLQSPPLAVQERGALRSGGLPLLVGTQQRLHAPFELGESLFQGGNRQFWQRMGPLVFEHGASEEGCGRGRGEGRDGAREGEAAAEADGGGNAGEKHWGVGGGED